MTIADLYGGRVEAFRYDLLDLTNEKVDELRVSTKVVGSLDLSTQATPQGSGSATITPTTPVDWLRHRVRIWYTTDSGREVPLITAIPKVPGITGSATSIGRQMQLFDNTEILNSDRYGTAYGLPAGTPITNAAADVIASTGETSAVIDPSDALLPVDTVWDAQATKLRIVNDLLAAANYNAVAADPYGRLRGTRWLPPNQRPNAWTFDAGPQNLYTPEWVREANTYDVPNRVVVTSRALADGTTWTATATDTDPESPYSLPSRKRWITPPPTADVLADSPETLQAIANRKLSEAQQVAVTWTIQHPWLPFGLLDVVQIAVPRAGDTTLARASVQRQTISLTAGGMIRTTLQKVV